MFALCFAQVSQANAAPPDVPQHDESDACRPQTITTFVAVTSEAIVPLSKAEQIIY